MIQNPFPEFPIFGILLRPHAAAPAPVGLSSDAP
jgi:hypothetical protein